LWQNPYCSPQWPYYAAVDYAVLCNLSYKLKNLTLFVRYGRKKNLAKPMSTEKFAIVEFRYKRVSCKQKKILETANSFVGKSFLVGFYKRVSLL